MKGSPLSVWQELHIPVEDQNGDAGRRSGCRDEPAAQLEAVGRLDGHRLDLGQPDFKCTICWFRCPY